MERCALLNLQPRRTFRDETGAYDDVNAMRPSLSLSLTDSEGIVNSNLHREKIRAQTALGFRYFSGHARRVGILLWLQPRYD